MPTLIGETLNSCIASCTVREGAAPPAVVDMTRKWRNIDEFRETIYRKVRELHVQKYPYNDFLYMDVE